MSSKQNEGKVSGFRRVMNWIKNRYELISDFDVVLVFILFAVTGSSSVRVARPFLESIGVNESMNPLFFWPLRIFLVFIVYQLLFVAFGFIIGLISKPIWHFAWSFEKKMLSRFGLKFD